MGGVIDGGFGVNTKASPRRTVIEKTQVELRQEYDAREERRRELEFLEKGGNPLDFSLGPAPSVSFQSTSSRDHFVTSEAKGSFALTASPPGGSVESSGRPEDPQGRETNTADNLLLFKGENNITEGEKLLGNRSRVPLSETSSQVDVTRNANDSEDLSLLRFVVKKSHAYARRNRTRTSRDARACSTGLPPVGDGKGAPILASPRHVSRKTKGLGSGSITREAHSVSSMGNSKSASPKGVVLKSVASGSQLDMELDAPLAYKKVEGELNTSTSKDLRDTEDIKRLKIDPDQVPDITNSVSTELSGERLGVPSSLECNKLGKFSTVSEARGLIIPNTDVKERQQGLDREASIDQLRKIKSSGTSKEHKSANEDSPNLLVADAVKENNEMKNVEVLDITEGGLNSVRQNCRINDSSVKVEEEIFDHEFGSQDQVEVVANMDGSETNAYTVKQNKRKLNNVLGNESHTGSAPPGDQKRQLSTSASSQSMLPEATFSGRGTKASLECNTCMGSHIIVANNVHEDSILEEARIIESKRKRIAELSVGNNHLESRRKSHWDFVLEEMAWLANDFIQERLWKTTLAAQICNMVALNVRSRFDKQNLCGRQKQVAHTLSKAILQFWQSADVFASSDDPSVVVKDWNLALVQARNICGSEAVNNRVGEPNMEEMNKYLEEESFGKGPRLAIQGYAVRFLKSTSTFNQAEAPLTPDRISDLGIVEWEDKFSEETLFYAVPFGAMEDYRKSIELYWSQYQKCAGNLRQGEVGTSVYDAEADFEARGNAYNEYEREAGNHYLPGAFEGSRSTKSAQRKQKNSSKSYSARSYEFGAEMSCGQYPHPLSSLGKRPSNDINVGSIPTKRVRTATRQRAPSSFGAGTAGGVQLPPRNDASSGDTSSFQDDQSTVHCGSQIRENVEVESTGELGKHLHPDSTKKPKKKKPKHPLHKHTKNAGTFVMGKGTAYEHRWPLDSIVKSEQRDHSKKLLEIESNGNSVASSVGNLSSSSKLIKMFAGRDHGRKNKVSKMPTEQLELGCPWSPFEEQALVVLVHDLGPNWELVSDVMNSTLQLKCTFRKASDCKEHHKVLMDKNSGDGADSAEDSGSSQPYPSSLPGIPKGSARQLFQRLQGPKEEEAIKSHFEKIILIGRHRHSRKLQNDNQDPKQITPVHSSHAIAVSQACPSNSNGVTLTPLELCDATTLSSDILSLGITNQGSDAPVIPTSGSSSMPQVSSDPVLDNSLLLPSSSPSAPTRDGHKYGGPRQTSLPVDEQQRMQHYNHMVSGRKVHQPGLSATGSLAGTDRGVRVLPGGNGIGMMTGINRGMPMPRPGFQGVGSPSRNMVSSGSLLSTNGAGMPNSVTMNNGSLSGHGATIMRSRDMHMTRPGQNSDDQIQQMMMQELQMQQVTQGTSQVVPPFNGLSTGFSNQIAPPPGQTFSVQHPQQQHQMLQKQAYGPMMHQQAHLPHIRARNPATTPQQHAYMVRLAKERQLQQRMRHHQQQQHTFPTSGSNTPITPGQPQSQHPISSPVQNISQIQQQASSDPSQNTQVPPTSSSSSPNNPIISQSQPKHHLPHVLGRGHQSSNAESLPERILKQRQRHLQPQQQPSRHLAQQRQQSELQPQVKSIKGIGRGNVMMPQKLPIDPFHINGIPATIPGSQVPHEKGEQVMQLVQGGSQGLFSGSNLVQPCKSPVTPQSSNQCSPQQKLISRSPSSLSKQMAETSPHSDQLSRGQSPSVFSPAHSILASQPSLPRLAVSSGQEQQPPRQQQQQRKQVGNSHQTAERMKQQNRQMSSDPHVQSPVEQPSESTLQVGRTSLSSPQDHTESFASVTPAVSSASSASFKLEAASEPLHESGISSSRNDPSAVVDPPPLTSTRETEPAPSSSVHDFNQKQFSGYMLMHGNNVGTQWHSQRQHPSAGQQPESPGPPSHSPSPHNPEQPQPQQQQTPQAGNSGGDCVGPSNSRSG